MWGREKYCPMAPLTTLASVCLERYAIFDSIKDNSWSNPASLSELSLLAGEVDCIWQIFRTLTARDSVGLPLQLEQAQTPGQLVTFVIGSKPVAEGTIVGHKGFIDAVMDPDNHINVTHSCSVIRLTHVLVPGQTHRLHRQTLQWISDHGALVVVTMSQLRTRSETPPHPSSTAPGFTCPAVPSTASITHTDNFSPSPPPSIPPSTSDNNDDNEDSDLESEELPADEDDRDDTSTGMDVFTEAVNLARSVIQQSAAGDGIPSCVLDDAFHFMDCLLRLLSKHTWHSTNLLMTLARQCLSGIQMMKQRSVQYWKGKDYLGSTTNRPRGQFLIFAFDATSPSQRFSMSVLSCFSRHTWRSTVQQRGDAGPNSSLMMPWR